MLGGNERPSCPSDAPAALGIAGERHKLAHERLLLFGAERDPHGRLRGNLEKLPVGRDERAFSVAEKTEHARGGLAGRWKPQIHGDVGRRHPVTILVRDHVPAVLDAATGELAWREDLLQSKARKVLKKSG